MLIFSLKQASTPRGAATPKLPSPQTDVPKTVPSELPPPPSIRQQEQQPQAPEVSSTVSSTEEVVEVAPAADLINIESTTTTTITETLVDVTSTTQSVDSSEASSNTANEPVTVVTTEITTEIISQPQTEIPSSDDVPVAEVGKPVEFENNEMTGELVYRLFKL